MALINIASRKGRIGNALALPQHGAGLFKPQAVQPRLGRQARRAAECTRKALAPQASPAG